MLTKLFAVYDIKVAAYLQLFPADTAPAAIRMITDVVNDPNTTLSKHPHDYHLHELGSWDSQTGKLTSLNAPHPLGCVAEFKMAPNDPQLGPVSLAAVS